MAKGGFVVPIRMGFETTKINILVYFSIIYASLT